MQVFLRSTSTVRLVLPGACVIKIDVRNSQLLSGAKFDYFRLAGTSAFDVPVLAA